ncbi:hypothetical protein QCBJ_23230 [Pseudomonas sp. QC2]|uniref:putative phage abortive infection protein n=1 Tax=Pseudomonas sp. QC2 TaxID=2065822 RepID=UPI000C7A6117|nr:putative phage abortive infection protein [Pseudomonas sp. QC2]PLR61137.1 hypothetical protein QCBJ_23230 [Pseudomonas sp. QC2]
MSADKISRAYKKAKYGSYSQRLMRWIYQSVTESVFGTVLMLASIILIACVGSFILMKVSFGVDLPFFGFNFVSQLSSLGQFGDFFGGVLNPMLSFMALLGVLYTVRTQGRELKEAREENRIANRIQDKQTAVFERQNFESVFFRLIDVHSQIAERIRSRVDKYGATGFAIVVADVMDRFSSACSSHEFDELLKPEPQYKQVKSHLESLEVEWFKEAAEHGIVGENRVLLSQYYRNFYQIFKLIDGYKVYFDSESSDRSRRRRSRVEYFQRRQYCNILRAQLSDDELKLLFFNCVTSSGDGLKRYVEQYSLLKHLRTTEIFKGREHLLSMYDEAAYADYEKISDEQIHNFDRARSRSQFRNVFITLE